MRYFALIFTVLIPTNLGGQQIIENLSKREQSAHLIGSCAALIGHGNSDPEIRKTDLWNQYARPVNDMIRLLKEERWEMADVKISKPAGRDVLAKLLTDQMRFTEDVYLNCLEGLKDVIKNEYEPNYIPESK